MGCDVHIPEDAKAGGGQGSRHVVLSGSSSTEFRVVLERGDGVQGWRTHRLPSQAFPTDQVGVENAPGEGALQASCPALSRAPGHR